MDANILSAGLIVRHRHSDGSWGELESREHHSSADHDPERDWGRGHLYVCSSCDEQVLVERASDEDAGAP